MPGASQKCLSGLLVDAYEGVMKNVNWRSTNSFEMVCLVSFENFPANARAYHETLSFSFFQMSIFLCQTDFVQK